MHFLFVLHFSSSFLNFFRFVFTLWCRFSLPLWFVIVLGFAILCCFTFCFSYFCFVYLFLGFCSNMFFSCPRVVIFCILLHCETFVSLFSHVVISVSRLSLNPHLFHVDFTLFDVFLCMLSIKCLRYKFQLTINQCKFLFAFLVTCLQMCVSFFVDFACMSVPFDENKRYRIGWVLDVDEICGSLA